MITITLENNYKLELTGDESISLNYYIASVSDFTKRLGSFSKEILVPGTKANNDVFQHFYSLGADGDSTYNPNLKVKATIESDSTVIFYGYIQLNKVTRKLDSNTIYYSITFYSDLNRFIKNRAGKYISELTNLSAFTHDYTWVNINSTWDAPKGYGYMYPMVDRNRNYNLSIISIPTTATTVNMSEYYPAMYVKTIWDGIFADAGYTYDFPFAHTEKFKSLVFTIDKLTHSDNFIKENEYKAVLNSGWTIDSSGIPEYFFGTIKFIDDYLYGYDVGNHYNPSTGEYTFTERVKASFDIAFNFTSTFLGEFELRLIKNGSQIWNGTFRNTTINGNQPNMPNIAPFTVQIPEFQFVPGDVISIYMGYMSYNIATIQEGSYIRMNVNAAIMPGDEIEFSQILPKISQVDFFNSIVKMFNLYVEPSKEFENELMIRSKDDYYSGQGYVNWSSKLDISKKLEIKPLSELQAKTIKFSWLEDSDYLNKYYSDRWNETFGQEEIVVENDFLSINSVQEIKTVFAPTVMSNVIGSTIMQIPKVFSIDETTGLYKKGNNKPKVFFFNEKLSCEKYYVRSDNGAMYATNTFPYCSTLYGDIGNPEFDLNWGTPRQIFVNLSGQTTYPESNLVSEYYENTLDEILESKLVTCYMHLTHSDIAQLNFRKQVFLTIDGSGHYFKLISIQDFDPTKNGLCKVELLQSLNINPNPSAIRQVRYITKSEVHNVERLINQINIGTDNQILSNNNLVVGRGNTINDLSLNNIVNGDNNELKSGVQNSLLIGYNNSIQESNSSIIGGSGNTTCINNTSVINSFNTRIITGGTSANTNNVTVINSDNLTISGKSNITVIGVQNQRQFDYSANTYVNGLSIFELSGITINVAGVQTDGKLIKLPFSAITSGITIPTTNQYWTGSTGYQSLKRNNSGNNNLSGEYAIITAGKNNYVSSDNSGVFAGLNNSVYTAASSILGGRRNTIGGFTAYSSIVGGSGNTTMGSYSSILAGQNNYNSHTASSILAGRNMTSVSADTAHAHNLFIRNSVRISGLTGVGNRMVITSSNGTLSTQSIPTSYPAKWIAGTAYSSVILNNGYTSSNSDYSLVAGKNTTIGAGSPYSVILGGLSNKNLQNSKYSAIVSGFENYIRDYSKYAFIGAGRGSYIYNSQHSLIGTGYGNRIYNSNSISESKYNTILNGYNNKIIRSTHSTILGGYNSVIGISDNLYNFNLLFGKNHILQAANYSAIIGGVGYTLTESYTVLVPKLKIGNLPTQSSSFLINSNSSGNVYKISVSGGTGIRINNTSGLLTITYTGSTSTNTTINNGINTFTGGTSNFQSVNVTALTINNLTVSGNSILNNLSATTIFSGSTNLSNIFELRQTNYRQILSSNYVYTSSTAVANFTFPVNAGEIYKVEMFSLFQVNNTGGMKLTISGDCLINGVIRGNTSSVLTANYRPINSSGNTSSMGTAANTTFPYCLEGIFSAITNTTIALGFSPFTSGQQITVFSGACMTLQKI